MLDEITSFVNDNSANKANLISKFNILSNAADRTMGQMAKRQQMYQ